jgi:tetratricopeptide repeat protein
LFDSLAVFAGGCTLQAAESVCGSDLDSLESLVEKSLVRQEHGRYSMLETIREFAHERLNHRGTVAEVCSRHARFFAGIADIVRQEIRGAGQARAIEQLRTERDNVRAAIEWEMGVDPAVYVRLVAAIGATWAQFIGSTTEASRWLALALDVDPNMDAQLRATLHKGAATTAMHAGDYSTMRMHAQAAMELRRTSGDDELFIDSLSRLADATLLSGDLARANELYVKAIASARASGHRAPLAEALGNLGYLLLAEGDAVGAIEVCTESIELHRALGNRSGVAAGHCNLGLASLIIGRLDAAAASFRDGLELSVEIGQAGLRACCIEGLAAVATARGANELAARLVGHAGSLLSNAGSVFQPVESEVHERTLTTLRAQLAGGALDAVLDAGRRMPSDEAIAQALSID